MSLSLTEDAIQHTVYLLLDSLQTVFIHIHLPFEAFHVLFNQLRKHLNDFCLRTLCHQVGIFAELVDVAIVIWIVIPVPFHVHQMLLSPGTFSVMITYLNPTTHRWDGPQADFTPESDHLPWSMVPERRITVEDVKYVLSSYYQGTPYNPYGKYGDPSERGKYRPIGVNRNNFVALTQLRPGVPEAIAAVAWIAVGSNAFNEMIPLYGNVERTPDYLANTTGEVTTENFYWANRLIAALADAHYHECITHIERYQNKLAAKGHELLNAFDRGFAAAQNASEYLADCNDRMAAFAKAETGDLLDKVLFAASLCMKNAYSCSDA